MKISVPEVAEESLIDIRIRNKKLDLENLDEDIEAIKYSIKDNSAQFNLFRKRVDYNAKFRSKDEEEDDGLTDDEKSLRHYLKLIAKDKADLEKLIEKRKKVENELTDLENKKKTKEAELSKAVLSN